MLLEYSLYNILDHAIPCIKVHTHSSDLDNNSTFSEKAYIEHIARYDYPSYSYTLIIRI